MEEIKVIDIEDIGKMMEEQGLTLIQAVKKLKSSGKYYIKKKRGLAKIDTQGSTYSYIKKAIEKRGFIKPAVNKSVAEIVSNIEKNLELLKSSLNLPKNLNESLNALSQISRPVRKINKQEIEEFNKKFIEAVKQLNRFTTKDLLNKLCDTSDREAVRKTRCRIAKRLEDLVLQGKVKIVDKIPYTITSPLTGATFQAKSRINVYKVVDEI